VFLAIGLLAMGPALKSGHVVGDGVDMYGTLWFYWWIQDCILELQNPSFTTLFFYPLGKDIFAHTGNNFVDAVASAPFQWLFGNPGYQRWFVLAVFLANIGSFRVLARSLFEDRSVVFAASLAWALNPYILFEITAGRLTQAFLVFLPLAFYHLLACEASSSWKHPVLAGLFTALQAWTYWFMGWFMAFAFLPLALVGLVRSPDRRALASRYLVAGVVCLLVVAPALVAMASAAGEGLVPGLSEGVEPDLFTAPSQLENNVDATLHGLVRAEQEGPPFLLSLAWLPLWLVGFALARGRGRWFGAFLLVVLMSLGPIFYSPWTPGEVVLPFYMLAYHYLPFFDRLWFPYRGLAVAFVPVCVAVGIVAERVYRWRPPALWAALPLFALATMAEQHRWAIFPFVVKDLTVPKVIRLVQQHGGYVIHLPVGVNQPSIVWQTFHGQPMFGGMGENAPLLQPEGWRQRMRNSFVRTLLESTRDPEESRAYNKKQREMFQDEGFRWVILHRDLAESEAIRWARRSMKEEERAAWAISATRRLVEVLGEPTAVEGTYVSWDLLGEAETPPGLEPTEEKLYSRVWESPPNPAYEDALREAGRLRDPPPR